MKRRHLCAVSILLIVSLTLTGCGKLTAERVTDQVKQSYAKMEDFHGVLVTESHFLGKKQVIRSEQWFKKPDKFRIEVKDPKGKGLQTTICNGKKLWIYDRQLQEVVVVQNPGRDLLLKNGASLVAFMNDFQTMADLKVLGQEKISGRKCYIFELTPKKSEKNGFPGKKKIWVDTKGWIPLKVEEYDAQGKLSTATYYEQFEYNTALKDELFNFAIPSQAKVNQGYEDMATPVISTLTCRSATLEEARQAVDFSVATPTYLPEGLNFRGVSLQKTKDLFPAVVLEYGRGLQMLTLTQRKTADFVPLSRGEAVKVGDLDGYAFRGKKGGYCMLQWYKDGIEYQFLGNISLEEMQKIAISLK